MQKSLPIDRRRVTGLSVVLLASSVAWLAAFGHPVTNETGNKTKTVASGTWSGEHVILRVSENRTEVEFDCAHGEIARPLTLDKRGNFDVPGTYTPEHGGPVRREDETRPPDPARYSGHVDGDTMSLSITREKEKEKIGDYTLNHNSNSMLHKCR